jgi:hypothetical protein
VPGSLHVRTAARLIAAALAAATLVVLAAGEPDTGHAARARTSPSGLAYGTASAELVQSQPAPGSCRARGGGLDELPDPRCTPGSVNPAVTQATLDSTICRGGWTATVRPPASITAREKRASMVAYGHGARVSGFEYDHLVALELGGAVNDARNLWPEPDYPTRAGFYLNPKDRLERALNRLVCERQMTLARAQRLIAGDWVAAYSRYG